MIKYLFPLFFLISISAFSQSKKVNEEDKKALNVIKIKLTKHNLTLCGFLREIDKIEAKNRRKSEQLFSGNYEKSNTYADKLNKKDKKTYFAKTGMNQEDAMLAGVLVHISHVEDCK